MADSWSEEEKNYMQRALVLARRGRGKVEPNPMVGAVVVKQGRILAEGYHRRFGGPHAEVNTFRNCTESPRGAELYVTLEPCNHQGKTPPCTVAIQEAGIGRVVVAAEDPNPLVSGKGLRKLRRAGLKVETGLLAREAEELNAPYMKAKTTGLPYVTVKWAMTLDGRIASASGDSKWITGELARRHVHRTRNEVDAVLVGIGTALKDDPLLTSRIPGGRDPARIILDRGARLPLNSQLVRTAGEVPVIVVATGKAPRSRSEKLAQAGCRVLQLRAKADGRVSIKALLRRLGKMGFIHLLVEGGQGVFSEFFQARQVDRVQVYVSPKLLGEGLAPLDHAGTVHMQNALKAADVKAHRFGEDLLLEGTLSWEKMQEV